MKQIWSIGIVLVIVLLFVGYYLVSNQSAVESTTNINNFTSGSEDTSQSSTDQINNTNTSMNSNNTNTTPTSNQPQVNLSRATLDTSMGKIVIEFYQADAPKTVANFTKLTEQGFYNGLTFHRVIPGFMIQGGDPNGNGTGGPGYKFADELNPATASYKAGYKKGVVAMANAGPNTNGSQFFIMTADYPLPNNYTIFGHVVSGQDVVDAIANVKRDSNDRPLTPVVIKGITIQK
ncbi:MAG: peptidylprolyl isomerase [Patescibacteria group bacterium]